ncbi:MAG: type II toxin-antitoxin system RelE/ParE family toxin [Alphaproteobacteria bacterium]
MAGFKRTAKADDDLLDIWLYIAEDNPPAATRLLHSIDEKCALLGNNPKLGRARPDIAPGLRYFTEGNYLILYREISDEVEIVRVLHGARNLKDIFQNDD